MLTGKQKRFLRSNANSLQPIVHIGKSGLTQSIIDQIEEALEAKELIKVTILQNCEQDKNEIAAKLDEQVGIEVVQVIGSIIVLYKESVEKKRIELPLP
ncbi:ribosome assembly RNA-binding protein YhbY [Sporosarcina sp. YIM B06819]|uniref:ribosome assembly RNA-binding protein YhbY n=1 Tax=Sporosarcina sp. YIM B06819 TaxID=3081769 RepID=UPI00298CE61B|nr:ribosome assembly RNA-binding protein YhbY [Sporosarcina sp. YIM B06819]